MNTEFHWLAVAAIIIVSSARLTRLWTFDDFPPVQSVRDWLYDRLDNTKRGRAWQPITWCPYCSSFWITAAVAGWGWLTDFNSVWFFLNGALAASYLASILMVNDSDDGDEN